MTEEELGQRLAEATSYGEEVEAMRSFTRAEIAAGRLPPVSFSRDFISRFRAPSPVSQEALDAARAEIVVAASSLSVRSVVSVTETLEPEKRDRTHVVSVLTERALTEEEDLALPVYAQGIPVRHNPVTPFDLFVIQSVRGIKL